MPTQPRIGILPLYIRLYDQVIPQYRPQMEAFAAQVAERLRGAGLKVESSPVCCLAEEVKRAVASLEAAGVDLLATLHLAYSPSLESLDTLCETELPLVLLSTTPSRSFGLDATSDDMIRNHGIHGVQDLACMLHRRKRCHAVVAGHYDDSAFVRKVKALAAAAQLARAITSMEVVVFGEPFAGMGDFAVEDEVLARVLGIRVQRVSIEELGAHVAVGGEAELQAECAADRERFDCSGVSDAALRTTNSVGLAVRRIVEGAGAGAFSFNFESFGRTRGVPTVPFLEASKAMARGIGYAGEADALTAALVGALGRTLGPVTFTEMFCPDWEGGTVFMSHMGECSLSLAAERPRLVEKPYAFGDVEDPVIALFPLRAGEATLVNIAPGPDDSFSLICSLIQIRQTGLAPGFGDVPHFWIAPSQAAPASSSVAELLEWYSEWGGTHHLALIPGDHRRLLCAAAAMLDLACSYQSD